MNNPVKIVSYNGKTIKPQDLPPEAWQVVFGPYDPGNIGDIYSQVSWVFRAVDIRANAVKSVPFVIENKRGKIIDDSTQYTNAVGFLPKPRAIFGLVEMALTMWGYAYLYKVPNIFDSLYGFRYLLPTDIRPKWGRDHAGNPTGLEGFERIRLEKTLDVEDVVYFWKPDPMVEIGPPNSSPLIAATASANVMLNIDKFASMFFERGAIKATLLAVQGNPPEEEKKRIKSLWGRVMRGIQKAFGDLVISADSMKPVVVGEGLEALSDKNLTNERRESIATALGMPHSILFSGAANYSVSQQDEVNLYKQTIIPDCEFIEEVLNEQGFNPLGYNLRYTPEAMDIFQEDEEQRAASMSQFMDAVQKAGDFEMFQAMVQIFGMEVPNEALALIQAHYDKKEQKAEEFTNRLNGSQGSDESQESSQGPPGSNGQPSDEGEKRTDLDRWRDKAIKSLKRTGSAAVPFETDEIPLSLQGAIAGALEVAATRDDVNQVFSDAWLGYP